MLQRKKHSRRQNRPELLAPRKKLHVKRGDQVYILAGNDRGKTGVIQKIIRVAAPIYAKVIVEGINMAKKAVRANPQLGIAGGLISVERPLPVSKVKLVNDQATQPKKGAKKTAAKKPATDQATNVSEPAVTEEAKPEKAAAPKKKAASKAAEETAEPKKAPAKRASTASKTANKAEKAETATEEKAAAPKKRTTKKAEPARDTIGENEVADMAVPSDEQTPEMPANDGGSHPADVE